MAGSEYDGTAAAANGRSLLRFARSRWTTFAGMKLLFTAALLLWACGRESGSGNVELHLGTTIELRRDGPSPNPANAAQGQYVVFVNLDSISHQIDSSDCPWLSTKPIAPGENVRVPIANQSSHCTYTGRGDGWTGSLDIQGRGLPDGGA
jgi:hypothetical protein